MPAPQTKHVVIRNHIADLAVLTAAMERVGAEHSMPEKSLFQLQVALDEVVSNVIKYAWPEGGTHEVEIHITAQSDRIEVEIIDDGRMFDPRNVPKRDKPRSGRKPRPGGLGLQMTRQLVDCIGYARRGNRNHTTVTKFYAFASRGLGEKK
jgi:serine/threonine-protein kinase RsbW